MKFQRCFCGVGVVFLWCGVFVVCFCGVVWCAVFVEGYSGVGHHKLGRVLLLRVPCSFGLLVALWCVMHPLTCVCVCVCDMCVCVCVCVYRAPPLADSRLHSHTHVHTHTRTPTPVQTGAGEPKAGKKWTPSHSGNRSTLIVRFCVCVCVSVCVRHFMHLMGLLFVSLLSPIPSLCAPPCFCSRLSCE